jgi:aryl-alcohol dehydrogenase-like predicted oxidoreductase
MQYRRFGHTDLEVSEVGFGAWAIGGGAMIGETAIGWGEADDALSVKAIHAAMDAGINFFDTADIYGLGHSEQIIGDTIGARKDAIIATKVGNVSRDQRFTTDYTKEYIISACEKSLKRLQREQIDYYQLHSARLAQLQEGECIEAMQQLQQQGKIRYWGLSLNTFEPEEDALFLIEQQLGHGFQLVLNLINQKALPLLKKAADKGYGIIARMPLQFGLLTGKFDQAAKFAANDHRKNRLPRHIVQESNEALAPVWQLCARYGCSKTELALSYVLSYPEVSTVIPGIRTPEHVAQNTRGLFSLTAEDKALIETLGMHELSLLMNQIRALG